MTSIPRKADRRREFIRHPSVQALLSLDPLTNCPRQAIKHRAAQVVARARSQGWEGPPFDIEILASFQGFLVETSCALSSDQDGCIVPGKPPRIVVNEKLQRRRFRFTVAHEIVHTLFPDFDSHEGEVRWVYAHEAQSPVEQLCQVGASELLMPTDVLRAHVEGHPASMQLARTIGDAFVVSMEAALRRLVDLEEGPSAFAVLRMMNKPAEMYADDQLSLTGLERPRAPNKLRVLYGGTSLSWDDRFLPRYKSVPEDSVCYAALEAQDPSVVHEATEEWSDVGRLGLCRVQASALSGGPNEPDVLCFLRPESTEGHTPP
jgi:Zn-dependent peptidase ImmA (M78 family)